MRSLGEALRAAPDVTRKSAPRRPCPAPCDQRRARPNKPGARTVSFAGLRFILTVPTLGVVLLDAGRVEFDADGEIVFDGGSHQLILGDVEGFCAFFTH
jgi:hypothetical protein